MQKKIYFHAFNLISKFGPKRVGKLLKYFPDLKTAWQANFHNLRQSGLEPSIIYHFLNQRKKINPFSEYQKISDNIKIITIKDEAYPDHLKEIHAAPFILYIRGNAKILNKNSIAIVGSRKMTDYGKRVCQELTEKLTNLGLVIISGLAEGIDTISHETCLDNKGKTIAVLGSGINDECIFPAFNGRLVDKIIKNNGVVISEYPPHIKAQRNFFPARNRIISGLSLGTIVIEAAEKSGALITAYRALEQNKEVFAVPGSVYNSRSVGCNTLIKKGAKLVQSVDDVLEELALDISHKNTKTNYQARLQFLSVNEKLLLNYLEKEPKNINEIIKKCDLNRSLILATLTALELKDIVKQDNNKYYLK